MPMPAPTPPLQDNNGISVVVPVYNAQHSLSELSERLIKVLEGASLDWKRGLRDGYISVGFIIEWGLGLKGYVSGNMKISELHANFFINLGGASAKNAKALIDFVKQRCKTTLGIELEEEIKYIGQF